MFQFTGYVFTGSLSFQDDAVDRTGLPHSEIDGSKLTSSSPSLIAGSRVLLRLLVPRHSLYALINLTS